MPAPYIVDVREYRRIQHGESKIVRRHMRGQRRWYRRPKNTQI